MSDASRRKRWARIVALQRQLQRIEHARLGSLREKENELRLREGHLIESFSLKGELATLSSDLVASALKSAARQRSSLAPTIAVQTSKTREREKKVKQAERMTEIQEARLERKKAERDLREIIEWALGPGKVSAP
jgi:hypothetical protein